MGDRRATFNPTPFAEGRFRIAYKGTWISPIWDAGKECVVKECKDNYTWKPSDWDTTVKNTQKAKELAGQFNRAIGTTRPISFTNVHVLRVLRKAPIGPELNEYVTCEDYIQGNYTKWCNNYGYLSPAAISLAAFEHWSWYYTGGEVMVADLQGVCRDNSYLLTDPAILSLDHSYGVTDMGVEGMVMFFLKHTCNAFCQNLPKPTLDQFASVVPKPFLDAARQLQAQVGGSTTYQHELKFPAYIRDRVTTKFRQIANQ